MLLFGLALVLMMLFRRRPALGHQRRARTSGRIVGNAR